jgi:glutamine synthetase
MNERRIVAVLQRPDVGNVAFLATDLRGRLRELVISKERIIEKPSYLTTGFGADGSSYGFLETEHSDLVLIPSTSKYYLLNSTLYLFTSPHKLPEREPLLLEGRNLLSHMIRVLRDEGIGFTFIAMPEIEFYLLKDAEWELTERSGFYFFDTGEELSNTKEFYNLYHKADRPSSTIRTIRDRTVTTLTEIGVKVKYHHHEVGTGQHEIELTFYPAVLSGDHYQLAKLILREFSEEAGMKVTFMPKLFSKRAGNGLHLHMFIQKEEHNIFHDENGKHGLSKTCYHFIGGVIRLLPSLVAFTNPTVNSYKRLHGGMEAPNRITMGLADRNSAIRIPAYATDPATKRFEFRTPDSSGNIYVTQALVLAAGIYGIKEKLEPESVKTYGESLPSSLEEALKNLKEDRKVYEDLGVPSSFIDSWFASLERELELYNSTVHPLEVGLYFSL